MSDDQQTLDGGLWPVVLFGVVSFGVGVAGVLGLLTVVAPPGAFELEATFAEAAAEIETGSTGAPVVLPGIAFGLAVVIALHISIIRYRSADSDD